MSEKEVPDEPSMIEKAVIPPENLSTADIWTYLKSNPHMATTLKRIYMTLFYYRLAFPWVCFLSAFLALPLAAKNERSGILTAITTAVIIVVMFYVISEIFKLAGQNGYIPPVLAGFTPLVAFLAYGFYLIRKAG